MISPSRVIMEQSRKRPWWGGARGDTRPPAFLKKGQPLVHAFLSRCGGVARYTAVLLAMISVLCGYRLTTASTGGDTAPPELAKLPVGLYKELMAQLTRVMPDLPGNPNTHPLQLDYEYRVIKVPACTI